jgi:hypothetical protein
VDIFNEIVNERDDPFIEVGLFLFSLLFLHNSLDGRQSWFGLRLCGYLHFCFGLGWGRVPEEVGDGCLRKKMGFFRRRKKREEKRELTALSLVGSTTNDPDGC